MSRLAGQGAVALLDVDAETCGPLIADYPSVEVAGYVSPRQTVVAGLPDQVDAVIAAVSAQNRFARRVNMEVASHTALMDPVLPDLRAALADITPSIPTLPFLSTVAEPTTAPVLDADYWVANVRRPVRFSQAITAAAEDHGTFIEISPHATMAQPISDTLEAVTHHHSIGTLARDTDDTITFHTNLNATHTTHPPQTEHDPEPHAVAAHHALAPHPPLGRRHGRCGVAMESATQRCAERGDGRGGSLGVVLRADLAGSPVAGSSTSGADGSWLVIADAALGAEIGRLLGDDSAVAVLPPIGAGRRSRRRRGRPRGSHACALRPRRDG